MNVIDKIFYEGYKLQSKNEYLLAIETYKTLFKIQNIDLNSNIQTIRNILFELSVCLFMSNKIDESIDYLLKSYNLNKSHPQTLIHIIKIFALKEDLEKAFIYYLELNNLNKPQNIIKLNYFKELNKNNHIYIDNLIGILEYLLSLKGWKKEEENIISEKIKYLDSKLEKPKISVCMIVKNEELFLEDCLKSIQGIAFEIIIVDTGSTDKSKEIALKYGKVFDYKWDDNFSNARNYSIQFAKGDWILLLDADEIMPLGTSKNLFSFIRQEEENLDKNSKYNIYWFKNLNKTINSKEDFNYYKRTLFRNNLGIKFFRPIHEELFNPYRETFTVYCNKLFLIHRDHERTKSDYLNKNDYYENLLSKTINSNENDKDNYYYYEYLANAYKLKGDYKKEGDLLNESFKLYTKNFPNKRDGYYPYLILLLIKYTALRTNDIEKLKFFLDLMLEITKDNPDVLFFLAMYYEKIGNIKDTISVYLDVIKIIDLGDDTKFMGLPSMEFKLKKKALERIKILESYIK
jgi:glycosyltransferase involved in cell wall biosynthesis